MLRLDDQLIQQFGELLNELDPEVRSEASKGSNLTVTLRFSPDKMDNARMRQLATLIADYVA